MKNRRILAPLLLIVTVLLLTGCASKLTVDRENKTITDGKGTYAYTDNTDIRENGTFRTITITYPNGAQYYWWERQYADGHSSLTSDHLGPYDTVEYIDGESLVEIIIGDPEAEPKKWSPSVWGIVLGVVIAGLGIWILRKPELFWKIRFLFWFKDGEPSDYALHMIGTDGLLCAIIGIVIIIVSLVGV